MSNDIRFVSAAIRQQANSGLCASFRDLINISIRNLHEEMENTDDTHAMLRLQGGVRALRQLLTDITPRIGE